MGIKRCAFVLFSLSLFLSGCDKFPDSSTLLDKPSRPLAGNSVVLDLAAVARALSRD